jgi:hypothetical protein
MNQALYAHMNNKRKMKKKNMHEQRQELHHSKQIVLLKYFLLE